MNSFVSPAALCFTSAVAAFLVALGGGIRARRGVADWTFVAGMALVAIDRLLAGYSVEAATLGAAESWQQWRLLPQAILPGVWLVFSLTFARLNADVFLRKWRAVWPTALLIPPALVLIFRNEVFRGLESDSSSRWILVLGWPATVLLCLLLPLYVLVLANLERTYRASVGTMRWRIKFMLLGVGILFVTKLYADSQAVLYRSIEASMETFLSIAVLLSSVVLARHLFRTTRFDSEVYPSQAVLEGSVILALSAIYLLGVGVFAKLATLVGGTAAFELKALVMLISLVLLAVLYQSDRVRMYMRRGVSRHFQRPIYDYQVIWRRFSDGTATCADPTELSRAVVTLSAEVFQALSVTIWLVSESRDAFTLAASTSLTGEKARAATPETSDVQAVLGHFEAHAAPIDIEEVNQPWAEAIRRWHPREFPDRGGHRLCAPLLRQGRVIGIMMVGDRVGGVSFPEQDMDMLGCVADHASTRLMNLQFAQRLVQAKELQAFQTMATFFVHDLKNAASTLNLMLQNLPLHFNDPAFREDALRGMAKTVAHMNRLIGRLGQLRHDLNLKLTPLDLNALVQETTDSLEKTAGVALQKRLDPLPSVSLDREQIQKVITNLVLNAIEATPAGGEIHVASRATGSEVVLTVADTGCGMTPEFIQRSLFRPFQTTKKAGLGIGMFQSKMIVEAHGGRLTVASTPGKGTTFDVHLPTHGK